MNHDDSDFSYCHRFLCRLFFIAIENATKINKAAIALLMLAVTWTLFMINPANYLPEAIGDQAAVVVSEAIERHLGSTSTTLFFLMGAMTIVELVDQNGGFNFSVILCRPGRSVFCCGALPL